MTRPPVNIHLECTADQFEAFNWTDAWQHQLSTHEGVNVEWLLIAGD